MPRNSAASVSEPAREMASKIFRSSQSQARRRHPPILQEVPCRTLGFPAKRNRRIVAVSRLALQRPRFASPRQETASFAIVSATNWTSSGTAFGHRAARSGRGGGGSLRPPVPGGRRETPAPVRHHVERQAWQAGRHAACRCPSEADNWGLLRPIIEDLACATPPMASGRSIIRPLARGACAMLAARMGRGFTPEVETVVAQALRRGRDHDDRRPPIPFTGDCRVRASKPA